MRTSFRSAPAVAARYALRALNTELPFEPQPLEFALRENWRAAISRWMDTPDQQLVGTGRQTLMWNCRGSLLRTKFPTPFCYQRWLCPFCYHRELVSVLQRIDARGVGVEWHGIETHDPEQEWEKLRQSAGRRKRQSYHQGLITWQYLVPMATHWQIRVAHLYPGTKSLRSQVDAVGTAFAYPHVWLTLAASQAATIVNFLRQNRGRSIAGIYREQHESPRRVYRPSPAGKSPVS